MKRRTRSRLAVDAVLALIVAAVVVMSFCLYLLVKPYSSVTFTPFKADPAVVKPDGVVTLRNTFCWDGTPFTADRWLVSAVSEQSLGTVRFPNGYGIDPIRERYADGCEASTVRVQIPPTTPPGEYRIRYDVSYSVPLKTVRLSNVSTPFTVAP